MSYEELGAHAQEIYDMAVEKYLFDEYQIYQADGMFYPPPDPYTGTSYMTEDMLKQHVWDAEMKFNEVHSLFNDFLVLPDPADFDDPIQSVNSCMDSLCSKAFTDPIQGTPHPINVELKAMTVAGNSLDEWDGLAAQAFVSNFVIPFESRTENQFTVASILMNALNARRSSGPAPAPTSTTSPTRRSPRWSTTTTAARTTGRSASRSSVPSSRSPRSR